MGISKLKIVVVDDSTEMLDQVKVMLEELGVTDITCFDSATSALGMLTNSEYNNVDLVICDQNMDDMSGIDYLKELRKSYSKEKLPFILLTSEGTRDNIIKLVASGGNSFIVKPPSTDVLKEKIESVIKS